jgi:uncharacterized protein (TIGR02145 family)
MRTLSSLLLALPLSLSAQIITLTFEGTINGSPTPLDSIRIMNLTAGGDTMIYFPNNILVLGATGLDELDLAPITLRNQPNPFEGTTEVLVASDRSGMMAVQVHDATGRMVAAYNGRMQAGQHRFSFQTAQPGVHILTVQQEGRLNALRMVALTTEGQSTRLTYVGGSTFNGRSKSDRSLFTWTAGDQLRYIGYATSNAVVHSAAIQEVPVVSATRTFVMAAGLVCPDAPTVTDIDLNTYATVQIGNQCWMAENLRTTAYSNGAPIPNVQIDNIWIQWTSGAWAHNSNDVQYDIPYGKLYNWYAVVDAQNVCPTGWHVPTDAEWQQMELALGMPSGALGVNGMRGVAQNIGGKLKSTGTQYWTSPNTGANNNTAFSAVPGGARVAISGGFVTTGNNGYWWSSSQGDAGPDYAWFRQLEYDESGILREDTRKGNGHSVRCVRD